MEEEIYIFFGFFKWVRWMVFSRGGSGLGIGCIYLVWKDSEGRRNLGEALELSLIFF